MSRTLNYESPIRLTNGRYPSRLFLHGYLMALGIDSTKPDPKNRTLYAEGLDELDLIKLVDAYNCHLEGDDEQLKIFGKEHVQWDTHGTSSDRVSG